MTTQRPYFLAPTSPHRSNRATRSAGANGRMPRVVESAEAGGKPVRRANPGDERTIDPADRKRRARAALGDLTRGLGI
ncbi:hypothetical protein ACWFNS_00485 [Oerskovia enterophila]|uniref:hypothetical protein n=1 Tax=Oerskovia TaxID=162491 RepID=UPI0006F251E0|nr:MULTISPECIES: hypothetical protein [unclassified Oerskovia]KRC36893.1 hypothetical protein ASE15_07535 [Oerskovia sp. Root22]KRD37132.1 hypothetical protein ASE27_06695 [Oerskovia sp. Root918]